MLLTNCRTAPSRPRFARDAAPRRAIGALIVAAGASVGCLSAFAQTASSSASEVAPSERAKRDADKVFHWIMIQGDRSRKPAAAARDSKDSRDDRPVARPVKLAVPEPAQARAKPETTVAAAEPVEAKAMVKPAERTVAAAQPIAAPAVVADEPKTNTAASVRVEPEPAPVAAPAVDLSESPSQALVALAQPAPQFSPNLMRSLRRGSVQVRFNVQPDGSVANLEVLRTSSPRLNSAALEAIAQWRFQPVGKMQAGEVEVGFDLE